MAVGAFTILAYHRHQDRQAQLAYEADKAKFAQVEVDMQKAYEAIVIATGKPDKEEHSKTCSRTSLKFEEGELWCGVYYKFSYTSSDNFMASAKTEETIGALRKIGFTPTSDESVGESEKNQSQYLGIDLIKSNFRLCALRVEHGSVQHLQYDTKELFSVNFDFECRQKVIKSIYPSVE